MSGSSAADLLIGGVGCEATSVADCCGVEAVDLPEFTLGAPEAAESKDRSTRTLGEGRLEGPCLDCLMRLSDRVPCVNWHHCGAKRLPGVPVRIPTHS